MVKYNMYVFTKSMYCINDTAIKALSHHTFVSIKEVIVIEVK